MLASIATLVVTLLGLTTLNNEESLFANADWMPLLGSSFAVGIDGMGKILCLLTAIAFPVIFVSTWNSKYSNANNFFALMLLVAGRT